MLVFGGVPVFFFEPYPPPSDTVEFEAIIVFPPLKINISPENEWLEDEISFKKNGPFSILFRGHVNFRESMCKYCKYIVFLYIVYIIYLIINHLILYVAFICPNLRNLSLHLWSMSRTSTSNRWRGLGRGRTYFMHIGSCRWRQKARLLNLIILGCPAGSDRN